ncbi:Dyp-type peroxidase [Aeromonas cavernicola]|uniref:Peroxidase n=1 Tax=Aeromonas cavernicola TaxID=1006623 RepID=A0A2H9U213_9GAMM|nr:Dyp-type peroxidase [Aeromonas cavernicola]PJG58092.1 peroxidase [Aeromonas cavernicola]
MTAQAGICAEPNLHALYLMFNRSGQAAELTARLTMLPALWQAVAADFPDAHFSGLVAIGADDWDALYPAARPPQLRHFMAQDANGHQAPNTPFDLFIQLRADRVDVLHHAGQRVMALLAGLVALAEEVRGFRHLDCRDLTGFVDGTENPQGPCRAEVALVAAGPFAAGSYLHVQRWRHAMSDWERLAVKEQEDIVGRTKADNIEYESAAKPLTSHIKRVNLKTPQGESMEILRQSMPWGTLTEQGLYFISCCHTPQHFNAMLASMYKGEASHFDHLLRFTQAVTGAAFFAPSETFLQAGGQ